MLLVEPFVPEDTKRMDAVEASLVRLGVGGCTCGTKTPVTRYHDEGCTYRIVTEADELIRTLRQAYQGVLEVAQTAIDERGFRQFGE